VDSFTPTTKTQQAISNAVQSATTGGHPDVRPAHLLSALLAQGDGITAPLLQAVGADPAAVRAETDTLVRRIPAAAGATVSAPQLDLAAVRALTTAQELAGQMGDEYVSTEHLLVGLAQGDSDVAQLLGRYGAARKPCARRSPRCGARPR